MFWDLLDWYLVFIFGIQLFMLFILFKIHKNYTFRVLWVRFLTEKNDEFMDIAEFCKLCIYIELSVFLVLFILRYKL